MQVILTGAAGWLGMGMLKALLDGIDGCPNLPRVTEGQIRVLVLPGDTNEDFSKYGDKIEVIRGDVRNPDDCARLLQGADGALLYHTAGVIHPRKFSDFYDVNVEGTQNLLAAAQKSKIKRAVIVSSNSPIGCNPTNDHVFDEESEFNPYMTYGRSKMLMEKSVLRIQQEGAIETVRVRAPWFYGPFQPARQTLFFQMIRDGKMPIIGNGKNMRSMAYIDNLSQGLILAGHAPVANGKVYWIADERPYSMNEIIDTVEDVLSTDFGIKCTHKRLCIPSIASDIAFWADKTIQGLGLYHQKIHVLSEMNKTIACSVALAMRELNYSPTISLREGMNRSVSWMQHNGIKI
ncbi:MAG: NAD(P)-dependent oxidoreductase [Rhodospirillales bacterium]|nr:NAD(P)-dependent oxidoreductase [Rhodospirillales bacterium]